LQDSYDNPVSGKEKLYAAIVKLANRKDQFAAASGIVITNVTGDYAEGELNVTERSLNPMGMVHGGCLCTLADTVAGSAVVSRGVVCVTMSNVMNFLAPAADTKKIKCVATPQKVGKAVCVYNVVLTTDEGQTVATGVFTFYVLRKVLPSDIQ
jgi:acyl-CoA thioesterase